MIIVAGVAGNYFDILSDFLLPTTLISSILVDSQACVHLSGKECEG